MYSLHLCICSWPYYAARYMEGLKKKKLIEEVVFYEPRAFSVEEKIRYTARNACVSRLRTHDHLFACSVLSCALIGMAHTRQRGRDWRHARPDWHTILQRNDEARDRSPAMQGTVVK